MNRRIVLPIVVLALPPVLGLSATAATGAGYAPVPGVTTPTPTPEAVPPAPESPPSIVTPTPEAAPTPETAPDTEVSPDTEVAPDVAESPDTAVSPSRESARTPVEEDVSVVASRSAAPAAVVPVAAPARPEGGSLPMTGSDLGLVVGAGVLLLGAGALLRRSTRAGGST